MPPKAGKKKGKGKKKAKGKKGNAKKDGTCDQISKNCESTWRCDGNADKSEMTIEDKYKQTVQEVMSLREHLGKQIWVVFLI